MLILDVEIKKSWDELGVFDLKLFEVSYIGAIDTETGKEMDFWEDDMEKLHEAMKKTDMVCGYNLFDFDMPVIANYLGEEIYKLPQLDLMVAVQKKLGYRPKLDDLALATFGEGKIGKGTDAVKYWAAGDLESLKEYCMEDVRVTKRVWEYGKEHGTLKYYDKGGFVKEVEVDWNLGEKLPEEDAGLISMF